MQNLQVQAFVMPRAKRKMIKQEMLLNFVKDGILPSFFSRLPFGLLQKLPGVNPLIPYYHIVSDDEVPHVKHLFHFKNVSQFRKDLDTFLRFYRVIDLRDLVSSLRTLRPLHRNSLLLTFDDGFREQYDLIAPILWEKGVTATFFINNAFLDNISMAYRNKVSLLINHVSSMGAQVDRKQLLNILADFGIKGYNLEDALLSINYTKKNAIDTIANEIDYDFTEYLKRSQPYLTSDQVHRLIKMGFTIGAHSIDHPQYSMIPIEEQLHQTRSSIHFIRNQFSLGYGAFAFPHGDDNLSDDFFKNMFTDGDIDVSFGNWGLKNDAFPRNFQRLSMERGTTPTSEIIGRHYARKSYHLVVGRRDVHIYLAKIVPRE